MQLLHKLFHPAADGKVSVHNADVLRLRDKEDKAVAAPLLFRIKKYGITRRKDLLLFHMRPREDLPEQSEVVHINSVIFTKGGD